MQTVKKNLIQGVEAEGEFCLTKIRGEHLAELHKILENPDVKYGDVKAALSKFKHELLNCNKQSRM
ncbi:MAG: hypothetical protein QHH06_06130 [Clostridiales bacterium]|jgi:hypothetical protein|nr:hypothetical protein [Eubacteriales bacterium]MDH7566041.1 hypothetical protein [Clostridiales bacterium]